MSALSDLLARYRQAARTEREKGTYFEQLIQAYLRHEPAYAELYEQVWTYADWARQRGRSGKDTGIDLVARTRSGELHAVQCKLYAADHVLQRGDLDSFFAASGKADFSHRLFVSTSARWGVNAEDLLANQQPPVSTLLLRDLEASVIDWSRW